MTYSNRVIIIQSLAKFKCFYFCNDSAWLRVFFETMKSDIFRVNHFKKIAGVLRPGLTERDKPIRALAAHPMGLASLIGCRASIQIQLINNNIIYYVLSHLIRNKAH